SILMLPMLGDAERRQLLLDWNDTAAARPGRDLCLHQLIEEQTRRTPDQVAVVFERHTLTYGELNRRANQLAQHLRQTGVGPDVLFTSGSTGRPKGVALEHGAAATFVQWAKQVFTSQELAAVLFSTSFCFDLSVFEIFVTLSAGGRIILARNALHLPTLPEKDEVTLINTVPSAMAELLRMGGVPASVKTVNLAGEALSDKLVEQVYATTNADKVYN